LSFNNYQGKERALQKKLKIELAILYLNETVEPKIIKKK